MDDRLIRGDLLPPTITTGRSERTQKSVGGSFSSVLHEALDDINKLQLNADEAISKVQLSNTASVHEAIIALEKADLSFRAMMQVRNKILEAYQEIMRFQV